MNFFYQQQDEMDCGPTCLRMIARFHGKKLSIQKLRSLCYVDRTGVTLLDISDAAEKLGFRTTGANIVLEQLKHIELPCIIHWQQNHFVVLYKINKKGFYVADPSTGPVVFEEIDFLKNWVSHNKVQSGVVLLLSPTPEFYHIKEEVKRTKWAMILTYLYAYRRLLIQLLFGLGFGTILQIVTPILTQSVVDIGINTKNINFVYLILIAQIMLFIASTSVDFIRSWILLHISTRTNIHILTDFLIKLMKLPIIYFESKTSGDIMQRMLDQQKIEKFLTGSMLTTLFYLTNLIVFTGILLYYNVEIFSVALLSSGIYVLWILFFLKRRRQLNYSEFDLSAKNQNSIVELISGIQEIKLTNSEKQKRWQWEYIQADLFSFKVKSLSLNQLQQAGSMFINQGKNIFITFLSVKGVIDGHLTLGGMMAIQYIVGMISSPIEQIILFVQSYQDAKISLERLNEIHEMADEQPVEQHYLDDLPIDKSISIRNLTFRYPGADNEPVLNHINLHIPQGKTTAIVGMSGSGKTTILKLLLRFFTAEKGEIRIGDTKLNRISYKIWREQCGTVMQEGYIFADTIAGNIAVGEEFPDNDRLAHAINVANIKPFIDDLPFGLMTRIGAGGSGISQGQKQRLLIARAVYKCPHYLFFDEATNALDAYNETVIMDNLARFFIGRTVIIVAHRLSTVKNADNIIVVEHGQIIEQGTHIELTGQKGKYYTLVKNQLELGI